MNLFRNGSFVTHSGLTLGWKIDCDALTDDDIECLAHVAFNMLENIGFTDRFPMKYIGVPSGGIRLAEALNRHYGADGGEPFIVDDVLTTGSSMMRSMEQHGATRGLVIFARKPTPRNIAHVFCCNWFIDKIPDDDS